VFHGEIAALGDGAVLYEPVVGGVAFANSAAIDVWRDLHAAPSMADGLGTLARRWRTDAGTAHRLIEPLLRQWESAGLITDALPRRLQAPAVTSVHCCWTAAYSVGEQIAELRTNDRRCGEILDRVLAPLRTQEEPDSSITLHRDGDTYAVSIATRTFEDLEFANARHVVLRELIRAARPDCQTTAVFHGGAVASDGRAILIAGNSGAGKSTLIANLVASGFEYVGDDLLGLDERGSGVWPFRVALSVKPGSAEAVRDAVDGRVGCELSPPDEFQLSYLRIAAPDSISAVPIAALCLPTYDASCRETCVIRLSPVEALTELLHSGTRVVGEAPSIAPLARFVDMVPAVRITYSDWRSVAAHVTRMLSA